MSFIVRVGDDIYYFKSMAKNGLLRANNPFCEVITAENKYALFIESFNSELGGKQVFREHCNTLDGNKLNKSRMPYLKPVSKEDGILGYVILPHVTHVLAREDNKINIEEFTTSKIQCFSHTIESTRYLNAVLLALKERKPIRGIAKKLKEDEKYKDKSDNELIIGIILAYLKQLYNEISPVKVTDVFRLNYFNWTKSVLGDEIDIIGNEGFEIYNWMMENSEKVELPDISFPDYETIRSDFLLEKAEKDMTLLKHLYEKEVKKKPKTNKKSKPKVTKPTTSKKTSKSAKNKE